jgi:DNA-binding transcriptional ArsR family regulator
MAGALQLLKALSEPVRIRLYLLLRQSSLTVSELSEILVLSQSNTSHHVKALRELDLLTAEKTGQHTYYALNRSTLADPRIAAVLKTLEDAAAEISELPADNARLRNMLAARSEGTFARWRMEQPDLPYSDIFAHLACGRRGRVIDIGCGEGDFFEPLGLSYDQVVAVDLDFGHTRRARSRSAAHVAVCCADAQQLPFAAAAFDAVVLRMALSQIGDHRVALCEASRVLKPGGFISVIDSDADSNRTLRNSVISYFSETSHLQLDTERILPGLFMLRAQRRLLR